MKKHSSPLLVFLFVYSTSFSQAPIVSWQQAYGGTKWEIPYAMVTTPDGGLLIGGRASSHNGDLSFSTLASDNYYVIKLNANREMEWSKTYGGSNTDIAHSINMTNDGGIILAGESRSSDGDVTVHYVNSNPDWWIVKLDAAGNIQWEKTLGGSGTDIVYHAIQTSDGGFILAGETYSEDYDVSNNIGAADYWIVKLDASGNIEWEKTYGGKDFDIAYSIQQTTEGGYIIIGSSGSVDHDVTDHHGGKGIDDYWLLKIDAIGAIEWQRSFGGDSNDFGYKVKVTAEGNFVVAGYSESSNGNVSNPKGQKDFWVILVSPEGDLLWQHSYGGTSDEIAYDVEIDGDDHFIVSGFTDSNDGDVNEFIGLHDFWVIRIDSMGLLDWQSTYGGSQSDYCYATCVMPDGSYFSVGFTESYDKDAAGNHGERDILLLNLGTSPPAHTIIPQHLSTNFLCWNTQFTIDYKATGTYNPGNIFTAEISTKKGGFVKAAPLGSLSSTTSGTISCKIPPGLPKDGLSYIRVVSSDPPVTGSSLPHGVMIHCDAPTALHMTDVTSTSVVLHWTPSACAEQFLLKWKPTDENVWTELTTTSTDVTLTDLLPGTDYEWQVFQVCNTDPDVLSKTSHKKEFTTDPLKSGSADMTSAISVYPNPATNHLRIQAAIPATGYQIMDVLGKVVGEFYGNFEETEVDVSNFPAGVYLVNVYTNEEMLVEKFIIE
jgi:hypothetical protein